MQLKIALKMFLENVVKLEAARNMFLKTAAELKISENKMQAEINANKIFIKQLQETEKISPCKEPLSICLVAIYCIYGGNSSARHKFGSMDSL